MTTGEVNFVVANMGGTNWGGSFTLPEPQIIAGDQVGFSSVVSVTDAKGQVSQFDIDGRNSCQV